MEIILAVVVGVAVIIFGALISLGNERQRKAIDGLREQVVLWAMQDLRIKRESLARDVMALAPEWNPVSLQGVDMFPHTVHVECVAVLDRKG